MGRPAATTPRNGPTAQGGRLALDTLNNSLGNNAHIFPSADAIPLPDGVSKTGPVASIYSATGSFQFNHLAHAFNSHNLETRNSENGRELFACVQKDFATRMT